jgi:hypothetical protein
MDSTDIDKEIQHCREVVVLQVPPHPEHATSLENLANTLIKRFEQLEDSDDIDEAITALCGTTGADRFFLLFEHFVIPATRTLVAASILIRLPCP